MRTAKFLLSAFAVLLFLAACSTVQPEVIGGSPSLDITTLALEATVIDFESNLSAGDIVAFVDATQGMSGADAGGFVGVNGSNPTFPLQNAAMIFDATCNGATDAAEAALQCSGGDDDLWNPAFGNVLIISEDLDSSDPDDADVPGEAFEFDFSTWDGGTVVIGQISATILDYLDIDGTEGEDVGAFVRLLGPGDAFIAEYPILATGDGGQGTVTALINHTGVAKMTIALEGSGAIDNITIATDIPEEGEGCTPGYWRNHSSFARGNQSDAWVGYVAGDLFDDVFGVVSSDGDTLQQAVTSNGGGEQALQRHAVAAILNSSSSVDYFYSEAEIIALVQSAYATDQFEGTKNLFAFQNELGCPLN
jgi:hypothetical protein